MKRIDDIKKSSPPDRIAEIEIIIGCATGRDRAFVLAHPEYKLTFWQYCKISKAIRQLREGLPLAYITGQKEFFGLNFIVNRHVLIPRPETELLVEETIKKIEKSRTIILIDIGAGSGCVPIAAIKTLKREGTETFAIDISRAALRVAKKNSKLRDVNIKFLRGSLLSPLIRRWKNITEGIESIIITANLPYLTNEQFAGEPSIQHEPKTALVADTKNGLTLYEKLFTQIAALPNNDVKLILLCEIDPRQSTAFSDLAKGYFPQASVEIKKDLAGRDRIINIEVNN
ncbi:MAG: peptide chain release factor N(5)-glutamine methyltransferase [Candidatus Magasanikbacteria bacterium]|nr:peptide chain release factor N(5)-glutamine methyltransferase [Candidatus Magasanikbacteria bacterium]